MCELCTLDLHRRIGHEHATAERTRHKRPTDITSQQQHLPITTQLASDTVSLFALHIIIIIKHSSWRLPNLSPFSARQAIKAAPSSSHCSETRPALSRSGASRATKTRKSHVISSRKAWRWSTPMGRSGNNLSLPFVAVGPSLPIRTATIPYVFAPKSDREELVADGKLGVAQPVRA
jgi:hypothetical protein